MRESDGRKPISSLHPRFLKVAPLGIALGSEVRLALGLFGLRLCQGEEETRQSRERHGSYRREHHRGRDLLCRFALRCCRRLKRSHRPRTPFAVIDQHSAAPVRSSQRRLEETSRRRAEQQAKFCAGWLMCLVVYLGASSPFSLFWLNHAIRPKRPSIHQATKPRQLVN